MKPSDFHFCLLKTTDHQEVETTTFIIAHEDWTEEGYLIDFKEEQELFLETSIEDACLICKGQNTYECEDESFIPEARLALIQSGLFESGELEDFLNSCLVEAKEIEKII